MTEEDLIVRFDNIGYQEEELGAEKAIIRQELAARLKGQKLDSKIVGEYSLTLYSATRFKTTVAQARDLGATVTEEKVDLTALKKLYKAGAKVPGVETSESLRIGKVKEKEEA